MPFEPVNCVNIPTSSGTVSEILSRSGWPGLEDQAIVSHWQRQFGSARTLLAQRRQGRPDAAAEVACFEGLSALLFPDDAAKALSTMSK